MDQQATITAAVGLCFTDQAQVVTDTAAVSNSASAVITAQQQADKDVHSLTASTGKLKTDVQAAKDLLDALLPPTPTPAPTTA